MERLHGLEQYSSDEFVSWYKNWIIDISEMNPVFQGETSGFDFSAFNEENGFSNENRVLDCLVSFDITFQMLQFIAAKMVLITANQTSDSANRPPRTMALASLVLYLQENWLGLTHLCLNGMDLPARSIARSINEACDLVIATQNDPELAKGW